LAEQLWAPWRFEYIKKGVEASLPTGCIFVDLPDEENDPKNLILFRGETAFVIMNRFPYTNGHLLVAPYKHVMTIAELEDSELLEINQLVKLCTIWLNKAYSPQGFNLGVNQGPASGAGIPSHIHWHVVPRWTGDTNFMSAVADTRVLPHDLNESYTLLNSIIESEK